MAGINPKWVSNRMSDEMTAEATETEAEGTEQQQNPGNELPADHPLVKTLAAQKAELRELRSKAKRFDEIEESQKTSAQKDAERITKAEAKAEAEAASVPTKVSAELREHLIEIHGIDSEDAELFLTATEPTLLRKQVARLLDQSGKRKNHVPREGTSPQPSDSSESAFVRELFGG